MGLSELLNIHKYYPGYFFQLSFKGEEAAFQEVSGISKEMKVEEVEGGGVNDYKYKLPAVAKSPNLVLKRALVGNKSKLANWCAQTLDLSFSEPVKTHDISLILLEIPLAKIEIPIERRRWVFHNAYPVKYSISDLKSEENKLIIESIELAYTYFEVSKSTSFESMFK